MAGFCRIMREESCQITKDHMLDYLISFLDDSNDFSWQAAKASHVVLLCQMEQGEVTSWSQTDKINRIHRANAQKHLPPSQSVYSSVYALPISRGFNNYSIVVALKVWAHQWANSKVRIKCDNRAVVEVLLSGKTKDVMLATCARNIWMLTALFNISIHIEHISGKQNIIADFLSRFKFDQSSWDLLKTHVLDPVWIPTYADLMCLNYDI